MHRAVLDTNVFVSGASLSATPPSQIINYWRNQAFILIVSPQLVAEYEEVLLRSSVRKYTGLEEKEAKQYVNEIRERAYLTSGMHTVDVLTIDPDDNMVLACAEEGMATHLVTGNKKHFPFDEYKRVRIVSPRAFLSVLAA